MSYVIGRTETGEITVSPTEVPYADSATATVHHFTYDNMPEAEAQCNYLNGSTSLSPYSVQTIVTALTQTSLALNESITELREAQGTTAHTHVTALLEMWEVNANALNTTIEELISEMTAAMNTSTAALKVSVDKLGVDAVQAIADSTTAIAGKMDTLAQEMVTALGSHADKMATDSSDQNLQIKASIDELTRSLQVFAQAYVDTHANVLQPAPDLFP